MNSLYYDIEQKQVGFFISTFNFINNLLKIINVHKVEILAIQSFYKNNAQLHIKLWSKYPLHMYIK